MSPWTNFTITNTEVHSDCGPLPTSPPSPPPPDLSVWLKNITTLDREVTRSVNMSICYLYYDMYQSAEFILFSILLDFWSVFTLSWGKWNFCSQVQSADLHCSPVVYTFSSHFASLIVSLYRQPSATDRSSPVEGCLCTLIRSSEVYHCVVPLKTPGTEALDSAAFL